MRVLFLPRYGPLAGSSRYMTYDYLPYFQSAGIDYVVNPLLDDHYLTLSRESSGGLSRTIELGTHVLKQALTRIWHTLTSARYDVVILEKDIIPYLPYALESLLFALNRRVIVMYDERTDVFYTKHKNAWVRKLTASKIDKIIRKASHVIVWNTVVLEYAQENNRSVTEFSTGIDMVRYRVKKTYTISNRPVRIGWIGSPSGYGYIRDIEPALIKLSAICDIELYVVSSDPYISDDFPVTNHSWSVETEVADLRSMDIGIMPLPDTKWAAGKSGCKMFQYMAVGLPVVVSPVGINGQVVENDVNGLLAQSTEDWFQQLLSLIENEALRERLGKAGRQYVEKHNSQATNAAKFIDIVQRVASREM